jgi:hypothetical protein
MSREWDNRAERQGGIVIGMRRRTLLIFIGSIVLGAGAVGWPRACSECSNPNQSRYIIASQPGIVAF